MGLEAKEFESVVLICLKVCFMDGVVSESEEEAIFSELSRVYDVSRSEFDGLVDAFFESEFNLEDLAKNITKEDLRSLTSRVAKISAESDGLEISESEAWKKLNTLWEMH